MVFNCGGFSMGITYVATLDVRLDRLRLLFSSRCYDSGHYVCLLDDWLFGVDVVVASIIAERM